MAGGKSDSENAHSGTCKQCHKQVVSGIKCVKCNTVVHPGCLTYLKRNVVKLDEYEMNCCSITEVRNSVSANTNCDSLLIEVSYLKTIIEQKDLVIKYQAETIESLKNQVTLLSNVMENKATSLSPQTSKAKSTSQVAHPKQLEAQKANKSNTNQNLETINDDKNPNFKENYADVLKNAQEKKCDQLININSDTYLKNKRVINEKSTDIPTSSLKNKKSTQKNKTDNKTVVGTATDKCVIKGVESRRAIFISRLSPSTSTDQVNTHLEQFNIKSCTIQKLNIKSEEVAAFKILINASEISKINDPNVWPQHTIIRPYRHRMSRDVNFPSPGRNQTTR